MSNKNKHANLETVTAIDKEKAKHTIEKLRENCLDIFGVTVSTFDGATYGLTGSFTVEAMGNHIEKWQNQKIILTKEGK